MATMGPVQMAEEVQMPVDRGPPADPLIGKVLNGRFTLLERIGAGGMGRVYRGLQQPLDRIVAVKILDSNYASGRDPSFQKRFFLEASLTARLRHPNTITVMDYGKTADGIFYIAMEYVEGLTLGQLLTQDGEIPWLRSLHIGQQICRSLREAHKLGLIHRDLKPANVMLLNEEMDHDSVKVLDFGLVKSIAIDGKSKAEDSGITQSGTLLGSPLYMAPEHARHQPMDARSDIYSLGVMLYQMMTGKPPFQGQSIDVIVKHVHEAPRTLRQARPDLSIPTEVEALVLRCLEKDPKDRFQSMDDLLDAMRTAGVSGSFASGPRRRPTPVAGHHRVGDSSPAWSTGGSGVATRMAGIDEEIVDLSDIVESQQPVWAWALGIGAAVALTTAIVFGALQLRSQNRPVVMPRAVSSTSTPILMGPLAPSTPQEPSAVGSPPVAANEAPGARKTKPEPSALLSPVRFDVRSTPSGAQVHIGDRQVGVTPFALDLTPDDDGTARALLTFRMDGFQAQTIVAEGTGPSVALEAQLKRKASGNRPAARPSRSAPSETGSEYKSNPYE